MTIGELQDIAHDTALSKGWWGEGDSVTEKLLLIHSEISEAVEEYRASRGDFDLLEARLEGDKPIGFAIELADAVIRIADLCGWIGIDLEEVLRTKLQYNLTRPRRHGGKRI